ncbi:uncharacterized protein LOC119661644 isoform X2 [Hermetia illucens]|uniref:uncharacterized protein LOC119661644 isoform X2 n=1 Tax=Hermetia illucens TaxID=343691 RepID=UPI0018CBF4D0|nr:uncharacterized protein LOC119661644 isoform X2 [Hermetia illucens]
MNDKLFLRIFPQNELPFQLIVVWGRIYAITSRKEIWIVSCQILYIFVDILLTILLASVSTALSILISLSRLRVIKQLLQDNDEQSDFQKVEEYRPLSRILREVFMTKISNSFGQKRILPSFWQ